MPRSDAYNLGVAPVDAKGTTQDYLQDYLAHPSAIPVQIMALRPVFSGVVKPPDRIKTVYAGLRQCRPVLAVSYSVIAHSGRRRRGGAGSTRIRPRARLTSAPARVCLSCGARPTGFSRTARSKAPSRASTLPSS